MNGKTAAWICGALLAVSLSLLLPGLALRVQDQRLESAVQTVEVETVDLSLLSDLSVGEVLYLSQVYESRVAMEQGRQLTEDEAAAAAEDAVETVFDNLLGEEFHWDEELQGREVTPWLYVGQDGQSAILWEIVEGAWAMNPLADASGYEETRSVTVTVLVNDLSGDMLGLNVYWRDYDQEVAEDTESYAVEMETDSELYYATDIAYMMGDLLGLDAWDVMEESEYEAALEVYLAEDMAGYDQSGGVFTVPVAMSWVNLRFNL
ncbi:MAG: hypothetical protein LUH36_08115 [Oscillospiraceae bacterium]|nr:hypothetical protein [Oscillospiraceae bacterium]